LSKSIENLKPNTEWATKKQPAFCFARVLPTVLITVFTLCYGPGRLFRGPPCIYPKSAPFYTVSALELYFVTL